MNRSSTTQYNIACRRTLEFLRSELALCGCVIYHQKSGVLFAAGDVPGVTEGEANSSIDSIFDLQLTGGCSSIVPDATRSAYRDHNIFDELKQLAIVAALIPTSEEFGNTLVCGISYGRPRNNLCDYQSLLDFCTRQFEDSIHSFERSLDDIHTIECLTEQAYRDAMTGLLNRNGWEAALTTTIANGFEGHVNASVFVVDVDDLKELNDTLGHAAGDEAIRQVAVVLQQVFEPGGTAPFADNEPFVARTGGDEFIGILFDCDDEAANKVKLKVGIELYLLGYSVSIGSATCRQARKIPAAIVNADEAMYLAKSQAKPNSKLKSVDHSVPLKKAG